MRVFCNPGRRLLAALSLLLLWACGGNAVEPDVVLKGFPSVQQTTDYTCGCAAAMAVMRYLDVPDESEADLAVKMHTHVDSRTPQARPGSAVCLTDYGTSVVELCNYFDSRSDLQIVASSYRPADSLQTLADADAVGVQAVGNVERRFADYGEAADFFRRQLLEGHSVMVCWNLWGGHWTVCIGYGDAGTPDFYDDDILVMADPYDSTDGHPDGFTRVGLVAFFYDWFCTMTPKPWQLQPYIVVDRR